MAKGLRQIKEKNKGNVPVYGSNGIVGYHSIPLIEKPCLIIGRKGAAGYVHISKVPCWPIDTTYYIIPPDELNLVFLYYLLSTLNLNSLDRSTAIPGLNRNDAYVLKIPLPPLPEQRRIVAEVERRLSIAEGVERTVEQSLAQSKRLRQSILKKAFEGRLVAQDASDEPAGVLLERIKQQKQLSRYCRISPKLHTIFNTVLVPTTKLLFQ
ncbi:MAG TPA: restriction endonuclease subunit S [Candidatus Methanoperedens sp.]|nr:restriction endonuclease subunit S [Candidatus Methanoperedens sp.]